MDKLEENLLKIKDLLEKAEQPQLYKMHVKGQKITDSNHVYGPAPLKEFHEKFGPTQHIEKEHPLVPHTPKPELKKGMNNAGIGGPGAIKAGAVLPSISKLPKPGNISTAGKVKIPGQANPGKKNPINVAEQTHNKDIKDIRMKEAHANLVMQKSGEVSFANNGQWSLNKGARHLEPTKTMEHESESEFEQPKLEIVPKEEHTEMPYNKGTKKERKSTKHAIAKERKESEQQYKNIRAQTKNDSDPLKLKKSEKSLQERLNDIIETLDKSNYPGEYDVADNAKRKSKNTGETTGIHTMDSIKSYGGSGPSAAAREAKEMKAKSKKMPVKVFSPEEIAEMNKPKEETNKTEGRTTAVPGVSEMGIEVRRSNPKSKSYARVVSPEKHGETAKEIAKENIKQTKKIKPKLP